MRCHHTCYFAICFFGILFIPTNKTGTGVSNNCALFCCVTTVRLIRRGKSPERFPGGFHALPVANQAAADAALCAAALCPCPPELAGPPPPPSLSRRRGTRFLWCTCPCFCVLTCGPVSLGASPASPGGGATPTAGASGGATDTSCLSLAASRMLHEDGGALTLLLPQGSLPSGLPGDL